MTKIPYLPIVQRADGSVFGCRSLRISRHEIDMAYDEIRAATPSETMLLKAMVLPILIKDNRTVMTNETMRLLRGIGFPEITVTYD